MSKKFVTFTRHYTDDFGNPRQTHVGFQADGRELNRLKELLKNNYQGWFEYTTAFGESRFVNLSNFDTVDFK